MDAGMDAADSGGGESCDARWAIVGTHQMDCYDALSSMTCPAPGEAFYGQDAQHATNEPSYRISDDGSTVSDLRTGLEWQRSPETTGDGTIDASDKLTWAEAQARPAALNAARFGGYDDWRLPSIQELYSLMDFRGTDPSGFTGSDTSSLQPFLDSTVFEFAYGDTSAGERIIDSQYASDALYVTTTEHDASGMLFGVNFADGRIKGYGLSMGGRDKTFFVMCVRGQQGYGVGAFEDRGDGTVSDRNSGLMWAQADSGEGMDWTSGLAWVEARNAEDYLGYSDWRMPSIKELHALLDYTRSPDSSASPAIDSVFDATSITNEVGESDYGFYWSGTTHLASDGSGRSGAYVSFGRAMGYMDGVWLDVHGAGAQRSDPKEGDPAEFATGRGPQGDAIRILNYVRLVRDDCSARPATPVAAFTWSSFSPVPGADVQFADVSAGDPTSWAWDFGDGATSDAQDPSHVFASEGRYTVTLRASNADGSTTKARTVSVRATTSSGGGGTGDLPTSCSVQADCEVAGACLADATMGCSCAPTPSGYACVPRCSTDADCPTLPGVTLACDPANICIPTM